MTLLTTASSIQYNATAPQADFAYNFKVIQKTDMNVLFDGVEQSQGDWTIAGLGLPGGGVVTLNTPLVAATVVTLARLVATTQEVDYQPFDAFPAETHEQALDKLTMLVQQNNDGTLRAIRFPIGESTTPVTPPIAIRANKYLKFNPDGSVGVTDEPPANEAVVSIAIREDGATGSTVMLGVDSSDANRPEIFVKPTNVNNGLVQLEDGQIPPELLKLEGIRVVGLFRGDDQCPKGPDGDLPPPPNLCTPGFDYRNPTQMFGGPYIQGDFYVISMGEPGDPTPPTSGFINLQEDDQIDNGDANPIAVRGGDGIAYLDRQTLDNGHEIYAGWYHLAQAVQTGDASDIAFNPAGMVYFIGNNVQAAIAAGDSALNNIVIALTDVELPKKMDKPTPTDAVDGNICVFETNNAKDGGVSINDIIGGTIGVPSPYVAGNLIQLDVDLNAVDAGKTAGQVESGAVATANAYTDANSINHSDYAAATVGGTLKARLAGTDLFLSNTATNP